MCSNVNREKRKKIMIRHIVLRNSIWRNHEKCMSQCLIMLCQKIAQPKFWNGLRRGTKILFCACIKLILSYSLSDSYTHCSTQRSLTASPGPSRQNSTCDQRILEHTGPHRIPSFQGCIRIVTIIIIIIIIIIINYYYHVNSQNKQVALGQSECW